MESMRVGKARLLVSEGQENNHSETPPTGCIVWVGHIVVRSIVPFRVPLFLSVFLFLFRGSMFLLGRTEGCGTAVPFSIDAAGR